MPDNVTDLHSRQPVLGTFHAVSCRDGASLERDGQPYVAMNMLETSDGRPLCEIQFTDGIWFLANPETDLTRARSGHA